MKFKSSSPLFPGLGFERNEMAETASKPAVPRSGDGAAAGTRGTERAATTAAREKLRVRERQTAMLVAVWISTGYNSFSVFLYSMVQNNSCYKP